MTTQEFIAAARRAAFPELAAASVLAQVDADLAAEIADIEDIIRTAREAGESLVSPSPLELLTTPPFIPRPAQDDEAELAAAAGMLRGYRIMEAAVTAYHRQLSRDDALAILNGVLIMSRQPGASYPESHAITPFAGYNTYLSWFAKDWSAANPDQPSITAPDPDIG